MAEPMEQDHLYQPHHQHQHQLEQLEHHQQHQHRQQQHQQSGESGNACDGIGLARVLHPAAAEAMAAVDPEPHMSSQFYTFNRASHGLMVSCLLAGRHPTSDEVRRVATPAVLASWRGIWKDRHEDTAYLTGWRRIQEKLQAQVDDLGHELLFFKNNPYHYVPFIEQWAVIVHQFHIGPDSKHLGHKETLDRIRELWTVGAKFYGVPESYVKVCLASCPVCNAPVVEPAAGTSSGNSEVSNVGDQLQQQQQQPRRRRFEYTESFEVAARDVPQRLQHLACKYKVVLCIRQKYIRYKPFLAEVKDYCCHRGGEPTGRKPGVLKRKRYISKRCGCSFRIRAIVPIINYDEKEKTFSYQEDGVATFKLHAVHSGHEPGPHEGSARIIHRFVDPSSLSEEMQAATEKEEEETRQAVVRQLHELQTELCEMEQKLGPVPVNVLETMCQDLTETMQRIRAVDKGQASRPEGWVQGDMNRDQETSSIVQQQQQSQHLSQLPRTKLSSFCSQCGAKGQFQGLCLCRSCELVVRQAGVSACHEEGSLDSSRDAAMVVSGYCADGDKWYEGMTCSLDTAHSVEFLGHQPEEALLH